MPRRHAVLDVDGHSVEVTFKDIAHLYIRVLPPDGEIRVSAPVGFDEQRVRQAVRRRWAWITHAQESLEQREPITPTPWTAADVARAKRLLQARLDRLLPRWLARFQLDDVQITLRHMRTRWGSCNPATRRISLNLELADRDEQAMEYVLVHELTHCFVSNHGPEFVALMDQHLPDWRERKELLFGRRKLPTTEQYNDA